ncbi:exodeoxyribonuclease VII small subunit [Paracoccus aerodenitrificans]|uniref:exodeoxyribonuclease VII small subunit n=1 Tax=Paracoccus aerodenitrificans TaxID=3017781 RepID=UPI0022F00ABC|nr:exodeoxyribonuclease VII small subunit [Paracoccus aerodenitrificans]WBU64097.1 exodeoxyribonuclease VII small subunit [Paracoccus aerodenitrificans]
MSEIADMSFEDAMKELESVVSRLESGNATLEDSIKLYERGAALRTHCETRLREAEERIEKITLSQGQPSGTTRVEPQ